MFVQRTPSEFEARTVQLGTEYGDVVAVIDGLQAGESVVTKGSFTLKSEMERHKIEPALMIASVLEFSLRQRILVLGLACLLSIAGIVAFQSIPIDAYPDVTNIQVQVLTDAPGWSPVEVERFVTYPLELQMTGLPGLAEIRSLSKFALSQVTVVFQDDVDIYFARQLVLERMMAAKERLPEGVEPVLAPVSTGLGEVYQYYLEGPRAKDSDPGRRRGGVDRTADAPRLGAASAVQGNPRRH